MAKQTAVKGGAKVEVNGNTVWVVLEGFEWGQQMAAAHRIAAEVFAAGPMAHRGGRLLPCVHVADGFVAWELVDGTVREADEAKARLWQAMERAGVR